MPRGAASDVILVSSSSSSEGGGEAHGGNASGGGGGGGGSDLRYAASADEVGSSRGEGADRLKDRRKKRTKNGDGTDAAAVRGEARRGGDGRTTKKKKKKKGEEEEEEEKKNSSPLSYTGDFVATSDVIGLSSPSWSFPMSRVRRLISGSESAGGNSSNLRTTLDSVFVINQAAVSAPQFRVSLPPIRLHLFSILLPTPSWFPRSWEKHFSKYR